MPLARDIDLIAAHPEPWQRSCPFRSPELFVRSAPAWGLNRFGTGGERSSGESVGTSVPSSGDCFPFVPFFAASDFSATCEKARLCRACLRFRGEPDFTALKRDGFGPSPRAAAAELPPLPQSGDPRAGRLRPVGQGSRTSRQRFYEPPQDATSRSAFRIASRKRPSMSGMMATYHLRPMQSIL